MAEEGCSLRSWCCEGERGGRQGDKETHTWGGMSFQSPNDPLLPATPPPLSTELALLPAEPLKPDSMGIGCTDEATLHSHQDVGLESYSTWCSFFVFHKSHVCGLRTQDRTDATLRTSATAAALGGLRGWSHENLRKDIWGRKESGWIARGSDVGPVTWR